MRPGDVIATGGTRAVRIDGGQERRWMDDGTRLFLGALADLGDDDLDRPLALPGWTGRPARRTGCTPRQDNATARSRPARRGPPPSCGATSPPPCSPTSSASALGSGEGPELAAWLTGLTQAGRLAVSRTDSREPHVCA